MHNHSRRMNGRRHTDKLPAFALALAVTAAVTIVTRLWRLQTPAQLLDGSKAAAATVSEVRNVGAPPHCAQAKGKKFGPGLHARFVAHSAQMTLSRCYLLPVTDLVLGFSTQIVVARPLFAAASGGRSIPVGPGAHLENVSSSQAASWNASLQLLQDEHADRVAATEMQMPPLHLDAYPQAAAEAGGGGAGSQEDPADAASSRYRVLNHWVTHVSGKVGILCGRS